LKAKVKGTPFDFLVNFFIEKFEDKLKTKLPDAACKKLDERFDDVTKIFTDIQSSYTHDFPLNNGTRRNITVDLSSSSRFIADNSVVQNLQAQVELSAFSLGTYTGLPPSPYPDIMQSHDISLIFHEYGFNRALHMMQQDGFAYWTFILEDKESPVLKQMTDNLCQKLGKCGANLENQNKKYHAVAVLKKPPELIFTGIPSQMIVIRIPHLSVNTTLEVEGKSHTIIDGDFMVSLKAEISLDIYRSDTEDGGISDIRAFLDLHDPKAETLKMNIDYPDEIKQDYWNDYIKVCLNDFVEPRFNELKDDGTKVIDDFKHILNWDKIMKHFRDANDADGAFLDDIEIVPAEGSFYIGINLKMKN